MVKEQKTKCLSQVDWESPDPKASENELEKAQQTTENISFTNIKLSKMCFLQSKFQILFFHTSCLVFSDSWRACCRSWMEALVFSSASSFSLWVILASSSFSIACCRSNLKGLAKTRVCLFPEGCICFLTQPVLTLKKKENVHKGAAHFQFSEAAGCRSKQM